MCLISILEFGGKMDKLLIVAAKLYNDPTGGGGTVIKHLIDTFIDEYKIDLVEYRTPIEPIFTHKNLTTYFSPILHRSTNKFKRRIINASYCLNYLISHFDLKSYKKIIIVHASKMFGFESLEQEILDRTILFPMYLTPSYLRSNEEVPQEYSLLEKTSLNAASHIITPSQSEKDDLINYYGVDESKITLIERGIDDVFVALPKTQLSQPIKLISVSAIKTQKNTIESIYILKRLRDIGIGAHLTIIGRIESKELMNQIDDYIDMESLGNHVTLLEGVPINIVAEKMKKSDLLILPSFWETFGRVVYEGFASGLPAIIRADIACFSEITKEPFVFTYRAVDEAVAAIENLLIHGECYHELSKDAVVFAKKYQSNFEAIRFKEAIL